MSPSISNNNISDLTPLFPSVSSSEESAIAIAESLPLFPSAEEAKNNLSCINNKGIKTAAVVGTWGLGLSVLSIMGLMGLFSNPIGWAIAAGVAAAGVALTVIFAIKEFNVSNHKAALGGICLGAISLSLLQMTQAKTVSVTKPSQDFVNENERQIEEVSENLKQGLLDGNALNNEQMEEVLNLVDETTAKFNQMLLEVQNEGKKGMIFDDKEIEEKFKVAEILEPLTDVQKAERKKTLQRVINQAYLNAELKQKGSYVSGSSAELRLLKGLGYSSDALPAYEDKTQIHSILTEVLYAQIKEEHKSCSLSVLRSFIKECALQARLKSVNIHSLSKINKFKRGMNIYNNKRKELINLHAKVKIDFPEDFPKLGKNYVEDSLVSQKNRLVVNTLNASVVAVKDLFNRDEEGTLEFENTLKAKMGEIDQNKLIQDCLMLKEENPILYFYSNYGKYLKAEMIQGWFNEQEDLGKGVCKGMTFRIGATHQKNATVDANEVAKDITVKASDRFFQAFYSTHFGISPTKNRADEYFPKKLLKKNHFSEHSLMAFIPNTFDLDQLNNYQQQMKLSNGWLHLGLSGDGGHAIILRLDAVNKKAWIIDPNVGMLVFEEMEPSFAEAREKCLECFQVLMQTTYEDMKGIAFWQLLDKAKPEREHAHTI